MTTETVTIPRQLAEELLAVLARKFDDAEGGVPPETSWGMVDAVAARALAETVGADPARYVSRSFAGCFPHPFKPGDRDMFWQWKTADGTWRPGAERETDGDLARRLGGFPYERCGTWADRAPCGKAADDPIHQPDGAAA